MPLVYTSRFILRLTIVKKNKKGKVLYTCLSCGSVTIDFAAAAAAAAIYMNFTIELLNVIVARGCYVCITRCYKKFELIVENLIYIRLPFTDFMLVILAVYARYTRLIFSMILLFIAMLRFFAI